MDQPVTVDDLTAKQRVLQRAEDEVGGGPAGDLPADQPTIRREQASRIDASHSGPCPVGMWEISATHSRLGAGAVNWRLNWRLTRSGAGVALGSCRVKPTRHRLRRNAPCSRP